MYIVVYKYLSVLSLSYKIHAHALTLTLSQMYTLTQVWYLQLEHSSTHTKSRRAKPTRPTPEGPVFPAYGFRGGAALVQAVRRTSAIHQRAKMALFDTVYSYRRVLLRDPAEVVTRAAVYAAFDEARCVCVRGCSNAIFVHLRVVYTFISINICTRTRTDAVPG
jgi:hypothetical protein